MALIDDPIKDWQEASSETIRRRVWEWYTSTLYTRLMPGGSIILIMTRWFEDDLAGRLLAGREQSSGKWEILAMPALSDQGNALWPEWFPVERLEEIRQSIGSRHWQALYQQQPTAEGGEVLRREWFRIEPQHTFPKKYDDIVQIWDTAFKEGAENGFSVCLTLAASGGNFYVLDLLRQRMEWPALLQAAAAQYQKHRPRLVLIEERASGISLLQAFHGQTRIPVRAVKVESSKLARTTSISGLVESRRVFLPDGAAWIGTFLEECATFPVGAHDDQVDALTHGLRYYMLNSRPSHEAFRAISITPGLYGSESQR